MAYVVVGVNPFVGMQVTIQYNTSFQRFSFFGAGTKGKDGRAKKSGNTKGKEV